MRDPDRRRRILALIEQIWMRPENADARLFQILGNAAKINADPYYFEDADLERALMEFEQAGSKL